MHKRTRRLAAIVAATAAAGLILSGCSGSGGSSDANGVTTIQFWHRTFTPPENAWYKDIVKKFNASQSKIKVVDTEVPADAWDQKMKAAQAAGKAPDIYTHSGPIQDAVNAGQLYDLDKVVSSKALKEIMPFAQSVSELNGKYYAYPLLMEAQAVLFWNQDMMKAAGLDPSQGPTTWDELMADCAKIKPTLKDGQYCISPAGDAVTFAWSTVGQQYNFSGHTALNSTWTKPDIDNPEYRALMNQYKQLWDNGYMPKQALAAYVEGKDYGQEKVAFKVSGSWMMSEIGSSYPDLLTKTGVGAFPNSPNADGRTATTLGNFKWVIDAKSKHADAAGTFLEWAIAGDPANVVPFFVNTQFTKIPVRQAVQDAVAKDSKSADAPWSKILINEIAPTAIPEPTYPWDVSLAVGTAMEAVMKGAASPDAAISTADDAINKVIQQQDLPSKAPKN
ncbi:ABC transporter substrate-binding protein [Microbacterium sp. ASV49]|uniref:Extracellular solute-binding protein n=1 Tax=Microbacterium candidum TaxID=3041922 RepID=A0ABT7MTG9_9MICO|nr:extracellular solute-binding protein [Microbacterium sp. ASV49]MDL9977745.1 extracellular solute-binding protein [Microbacterium sp. ASV49]